MNGPRRRLFELISKFLEGELSAEEDRELEQSLGSSDENRAAFLRHLEMERLLAASGRSQPTSEEFLEDLRRRISAGTGEDKAFAEHVIRRIERLDPGAVRERDPIVGASPGTPGPSDAEPSGRRITRHAARRSTRPTGPAPWIPWLVAAGVFVAIVAVLTVSSPGPTAPGDNENARIRAVREEQLRREAAARVEAAQKTEEAARQAREERERLEKEVAQRAEEKRRLAAAEREARDENERQELKAREAKLAEAEAAVREKLRTAQEKERQARELAAKSALPAAPPQERPAQPSQEKPRTQVTIAKIERAERAELRTAEAKSALTGGEEIAAGQGLEVGPGGVAVVLFPDKTRLEIGSESQLLQFRSEGGKRIHIAKGAVRADVAKQPKDQPMIFTTPHGEARVLGTTLRLVVDPDPKRGTRLEVEDGQVQLKNLAGKAVDVPSGHFAVAAAGAELKVLPATLLGLVGYWRFEEPGGSAIQDASGLGNHGVLNGNARRVAGKLGQALELDQSYVSVPPALSLSPGPSPWTIAAWIRKSDADFSTVVFKDDGNFHHYYYLGVASKPKFEFSTGDSKVTIEGQRNINDGKWHHVAGARNATYAAQIYVDGVLEGATSVPGASNPAINVNAPLKIGLGTLIPGLGYFKGSIDDVRIYNRALSADEIKRIFMGR